MTTPEPSAPEPSERARFDAWRDVERPSLMRHVVTYTEQAELQSEAIAWDAWQARAALKPSPSPVVAIRDAAERALAAYQHRFGSVAPPMGNFVGPIDDEMQALRSALNPKRPPVEISSCATCGHPVESGGERPAAGLLPSRMDERAAELLVGNLVAATLAEERADETDAREQDACADDFIRAKGALIRRLTP